MYKTYHPLLCRFHACDTLLWLNIRQLMQQLQLTRIAAGSESFMFSLNSQAFETICEFIEQMDTAYIHPRRDSFLVNLCAQIYSEFRVPSSWMGSISTVKKTEILPILSENKNLSQTA